MKKKLTVMCVLFYWLSTIVSLTALTHGAVNIAFNAPGHHIKGFFVPHNLNYYHHKSSSDMKVHIKKVLNMHFENSTLDKYISSVFNLNNVNPTYTFRLPDRQNRTLTFRKSDFSAAVFPNITNVNKFGKSSENLQASPSSKHLVKVKNEELLDELKHERYIFENNLSNDYDYDDNMKKIVDENVRSEKEFIKIMTDLNEDLNEEDLREKYHEKLAQKPTKSSNKKTVHGKLKSNKKVEDDEWEELGLSGWSGSVANTPAKLPKREKSKEPKKITTSLIPIFSAFDPLAFLKQSNQSPQKTQTNYRPTESSQEADIEMEELSDQLSSILLKEEQVLLNKTGKAPNLKPRWPITTTRDKHGDNDVFLARANNPFGHSTKWKYNGNISDNNEPHREGRSKRGVFHLYSMIKCATGCDPLIYKGYGCYCGFLGSGRALDGIDRCCKAHDYCYTSANCIFYTEYFVPYLWKCYRGKPLCAIDNGEWGGPGSCASRLCHCDLALSKCLRHYYCPKKRPVCVSSPFRLLQNLVMVF